MTDKHRSNEYLDDSVPKHTGDFILAILVQYAEAYSLHVPVTLFVNGMVISGQIANSLTYVDAMVNRLADTSNTSQIAGIKEVVSHLSDDEVPDGRTDSFSQRDARYITLSNPVIHHPDMAQTITFLRFRLSAVDGWLFGNLNDI